MVALAKSNGWKRGVELGLGQGRLFERLIEAGVYMVGVDLGRRKDRRERLLEISERGKCLLLLMSTAEAVKHVEDEWADFVFVDAAHSFSAVEEDIRNWERKVRPGGWFGGHDYHFSHPGVVKAVDNAFRNRTKLLEHWIWARA